MNFSLARRRALPLAVAFIAAAGLARAQYLPSQSANYVWGQADFNSGIANVSLTDPNVGTLSGPSAITVDPATGKFFIADTGNNRVLRYSSASAYFNGAGAEEVFGQPDFTSAAPDIAEDAMDGPAAVAVDASGTLWVADQMNNRVLGFQGAATTEGATAANIVLGQPDFDTMDPAVSIHDMNQPRGLALDSQGTLYVADQLNNRVLKFKSPNSKGDYGFADGVIGQINFIAKTVGTSATTLKNPFGLTVDKNDNLWVCDTSNNRLLFYPSIITQPTQGASASIVVGQTNLLSGGSNTTATTLKSPSQICLDPLGRLYVSDTANNRTLVFENPATRGNGAAASFVLGQTSFTANTAATTRNTFTAPSGVVFSRNLIFVTDAGNSRMLNFAIIPGRPYFVTPTNNTQYNPKGPRTLPVTLNNVDGGDDQFKVKITIPSAVKKLASISFLDYRSTDITSAVLSGTYVTPLFGPNISGGTSLSIKMRIKPKSAAYNGNRFHITFSASSVTSSSVTTQRVFKAKFKRVAK